MANTKIEEEFTGEYLILYNFAIDCTYSECIQPDLIRYLLLFYFKAMEQAVLYENNVAIDVYFEFNNAVFFNQKNFQYSVGEKNFQYIMDYYMKQTLKKMEMQNLSMLDWISLFNTTVAFCENNIHRLFFKIFKGSLSIKYAFFRYLSVLLFKESDNLLAVNESREFWTSDIWDFDGGCFDNNFYWCDDVVRFFDKEINKERIQALFKEIEPLLYHILEPEAIDLFRDEMNQSFVVGVFEHRKAEYLKKINCKSKEYMYWYTTF
ncbi:MAG: hypothetical protein HFJ09_13275 [Lachnospiraceae bacterium]|nr:hypothetical protein [Lachnospiraceae bacterium]